MKIPRPYETPGCTYKIKPQTLGASVYVTISNVHYCELCGKVFDGEPERKPAPDGIKTREIFDLANPTDCGQDDGGPCCIYERPFEIFFNTKHADAFEWMQSLATLFSAVLRQPGPFPFWALDELKTMMDPRGGYYVPGSVGGKGSFVHGVVHHIALVVEHHCKRLGLIQEKADGESGGAQENETLRGSGDGGSSGEAVPGHQADEGVPEPEDR